MEKTGSRRAKIRYERNGKSCEKQRVVHLSNLTSPPKADTITQKPLKEATGQADGIQPGLDQHLIKRGNHGRQRSQITY
jgi:hypothetical protein